MTFGTALYGDEANPYVHLSIFIGTLEVLSKGQASFGTTGYNFYAKELKTLNQGRGKLRIILSEYEHRLFIIYRSPNDVGTSLLDKARNIFGATGCAFEVANERGAGKGAETTLLATTGTGVPVAVEREESASKLPAPEGIPAPVERQTATAANAKAPAENNKESGFLPKPVNVPAPVEDRETAANTGDTAGKKEERGFSVNNISQGVIAKSEQEEEKLAKRKTAETTEDASPIAEITGQTQPITSDGPPLITSSGSGVDTNAEERGKKGGKDVEIRRKRVVRDLVGRGEELEPSPERKMESQVSGCLAGQIARLAYHTEGGQRCHRKE